MQTGTRRNPCPIDLRLIRGDQMSKDASQNAPKGRATPMSGDSSGSEVTTPRLVTTIADMRQARL